MVAAAAAAVDMAGRGVHSVNRGGVGSLLDRKQRSRGNILVQAKTILNKRACKVNIYKYVSASVLLYQKYTPLLPIPIVTNTSLWQ